jgi:hypothetical protein
VIELGEPALDPEEFAFWVRWDGSASLPRSLDAWFADAQLDGEAHWTESDDALPPDGLLGAPSTWRIPLDLSPDHRTALESIDAVLVIAITSEDGVTWTQRVPSRSLLEAVDAEHPVVLMTHGPAASRPVVRVLGDGGLGSGNAVVSISAWDESGSRALVLRTLPTNADGVVLLPALPDGLLFELVAVDLDTRRAACLPGGPVQVAKLGQDVELRLEPNTALEVKCQLRDGSVPSTVTGWLIPRSPILPALRCTYVDGVLRSDEAPLPGYRLVVTAKGPGSSSAPFQARVPASSVSDGVIVLTSTEMR